MKHFSEISQEQIFDGDKIRIDDIVNKEISILKYTVKSSRYTKNKSGEYLTLQLEIDGKRHVIFTGSDVLIDQLKKYATELPFKAIIRKINRYYSLT